MWWRLVKLPTFWLYAKLLLMCWLFAAASDTPNSCNTSLSPCVECMLSWIWIPCVQALTAINAFNGRPAGPNKKLVVKFADQKWHHLYVSGYKVSGGTRKSSVQQRQPVVSRFDPVLACLCNFIGEMMRDTYYFLQALFSFSACGIYLPVSILFQLSTQL